LYTIGIVSKEDLDWMLFKRDNKKDLKSIYINDEITNRPYQKMAIHAVCDTLMKGNRKALLVMATGSGKTRTAISLVDVLSNKSWVKNILFLADRRALVKQAKKNFKLLLPNLSLCNLLKSKDNPESRMVFSTYPTIMNAIDETKDKSGNKLFTPGHFDLIILDESHRSIYKKYKAIFEYFDSILVGLTATPKADIDINTFEVFDLANNLPTYAYDLDEAISEGYLNPYHSYETQLKFIEQGISYDDLPEEEKELFEETFDDGVTEISSAALNKFLFNTKTVDIVLQDLMNNGLKIEGGDKLGKTIIFAKNKKHADFIQERFNKLYPEHKDAFSKTIYNDINYVDSIIDDFETKEKLPQIAISVDMLDTGIDIPEILNLVFFKKIRSRVKFWQMIGRGTRLCENLLGPGMDKKEFRIFDYCGNFEYFRINKKDVQSKSVRTLSENLFNIKVEIIRELEHISYQEKDYIEYREQLVKELLTLILTIDEDKFNAKLKIKYIHTFNQESNWKNISETEMNDIAEHIAPLVTILDVDELAKRFDYLMLTIELAHLKGLPANHSKSKVVSTAERLARKGNINDIRTQKDIIHDEHPFTKFGNVVELFENNIEKAKKIIEVIDEMNSRLEVG
jgi:type I restriction enzyme R subunit